MKKFKKAYLLSLLLLILTLVSCQNKQEAKVETREVTDQAGTKVEIPKNVEKIADLWHANNQVVLLLGGADKLVATTNPIKKNPWFAKVYPGIKDVAAPFNGKDLQVEELMKLNPDVVLTSNDAELKTVRDAGLKGVKVTFKDFNGLRETIKITADVIGGEAPKKAEEYIKYLDENINYISEKMKNVKQDKKVKVLHIVSGENLLKVDGTNTIINEWIELAGAENVVKKEGNQLELTMEEIVKLDPDVIIIGSNNANEAVKKLKEDKVWATLKAVKAGKVYANPMGTFPWDRYSAEEALQILWAAQKFNPEVFKDLNMVEKTRDFYKRFLSYDLSEEDAKRILNAENPAK